MKILRRFTLPSFSDTPKGRMETRIKSTLTRCFLFVCAAIVIHHIWFCYAFADAVSEAASPSTNTSNAVTQEAEESCRGCHGEPIGTTSPKAEKHRCDYADKPSEDTGPRMEKFYTYALGLITVFFSFVGLIFIVSNAVLYLRYERTLLDIEEREDDLSKRVEELKGLERYMLDEDMKGLLADLREVYSQELMVKYEELSSTTDPGKGLATLLTHINSTNARYVLFRDFADSIMSSDPNTQTSNVYDVLELSDSKEYWKISRRMVEIAMKHLDSKSVLYKQLEEIRDQLLFGGPPS